MVRRGADQRAGVVVVVEVLDRPVEMGVLVHPKDVPEPTCSGLADFVN